MIDGEFDEVLNKQGVGALRLVVPRNVNKIVSLHAAGLLEHLDDGLLDCLVRIVDMDEDLLDSVWVQAARPRVRHVLEKNFKSLAGLDSNAILCVV